MFIRWIKEAILRLIALSLQRLLSLVSRRLQATENEHSSQLIIDYDCGDSPEDVINYAERQNRRAPEHWRQRVASQAPPHWLKRVRATAPQLITGAHSNVRLIPKNKGRAVKADSAHPQPDSADSTGKRENARGARRPAPTFLRRRNNLHQAASPSENSASLPQRFDEGAANPRDNSDPNKGPHPAAEPDRRKLTPPDTEKRLPILNSIEQKACSLNAPMKSRGGTLFMSSEITKQSNLPKLHAEPASQDAQEYGAGLKQMKRDIAEDNYAAGRSSNDAQPAPPAHVSLRAAQDTMTTGARPNALRNSYHTEQPNAFHYSPADAAFPSENACSRFSEQTAFETGRTSSFEHYEDPWPALPDAPIVIEADEIITAFRKCERLRMLDDEQRGTLWNA